LTIGTSSSRVIFNCDGVSAVFPIPIQAYLAADFEVILTAPISAGGAQTDLILNSHYTLSPSGSLQPTQWTLTTQTSGTLTSPYPAGYTLQVFLDPVQNQQTQYIQGQQFPSAAVQQNFDRLTQMVQNLQDQLNRSITAPEGDISPNLALPSAALRANLAPLFDANGNLVLGILPASTFTQTIFNNFLLASPPYIATATETAAGITPNTNFPVGSFRRYGMDPTGLADSAPGLLAASKCNADLFDDFPGGGKYLFNSEVQPPNFPLTIRGQAKDSNAALGNTGTVFILGAAAPALATVLAFAYADSIRIQNIGFWFAVRNLSQSGIHVKTIAGRNGQLRSSIIEGCSFVGTFSGDGSGVGDTNVGIRIDSSTVASEYSAFNTIRDCYFTHIATGILLSGNCNTNYIHNNGFIGYTGTGNAVGGTGINMSYPTTDVKIYANYFEGWILGINSNGCEFIQQAFNDFQVCTNSFSWSAGVFSSISNSSFGDQGAPPLFVTGLPNLDVSDMHIAGRMRWLATKVPIQSTRGFQEGDGPASNLRVAYLGYFTTPTFAAGNFSATGGGASWTVASGSVITYEHCLIGGTMTVRWYIQANTTCAGAPTALTIAIPAGYTPVTYGTNPCLVTNNGTNAVGVAQVTPSSGIISIFPSAALGAWTNGAANTGTQGEITFRIVS